MRDQPLYMDVNPDESIVEAPTEDDPEAAEEIEDQDDDWLPPLPREACDLWPGTIERIEVYAERFARGEAVLRPGDTHLAHMPDGQCYNVPVRANGRTVTNDKDFVPDCNAHERKRRRRNE